MKKISTLLSSLFCFILGFGQTEGSIVTQEIPSSDSVVYYAAPGWGAASTSRKILIYHWPGIGATTRSALLGEHPLKEFVDGWNGKIALSIGDTLRVCVVATKIGNATAANALRHSTWILQNFTMDTTAMINAAHLIFSGYSGGGGEMSKPLTGFVFDGSDYTNIQRRFKKWITEATGSWQNPSSLASMRVWFWGLVDVDDPLATNTTEIWDYLNNHPQSTGYSTKLTNPVLPSTGHGVIDDYTFDHTGTTSEDNRYLWAMDTLWGIPTYNKITNIHPRDIIQLSGQGLTFDAHSMFDEQNVLDPANGITSPTPTTNKIANNRIYFRSHLNNEWSYVVDLRAKTKLTRIYFHAANSFFEDSIILYKGGFGFGETWTRIGAVKISSGQTGWSYINIAAADSTRLLRIGHKGDYESLYGVAGAADVSEIVLYGDALETRRPTPASTYSGSFREQKTNGELSMANRQLGKVKSFFTRFKKIHRQGVQIEWLEQSGGLDDYPNNTYGYNEFGAWPSAAYQLERYNVDSIVNIQRHQYFTMLVHSNTRYRDQGGPAEGFQTNNYGENPISFQYYTRVGNFHFQRAVMYGKNRLDTTIFLSMDNSIPKYSGLALMKYHENGNEIDKNWGGCDTCTSAGNRYLDPLQYAVQSQMDYDGYEQRYGPKIGIKVADFDAELIEAGIVGLDTLLSESRTKITKYQRSDSANLFFKFNFHYYPQEGGYGKHPIKDSLIYKLNKVSDFCYRVDPDRELWMTEIGVDANATAPFGVPHSDSYSDRQMQSHCRLYIKAEFSMAKWDGMFMYNTEWNADDANNGGYQTSQEIKLYPVEEVQICGYTDAQYDSVLGNFRGVAYNSYGWQQNYIVKMANKFNDSLAFFCGKPNTTGLTSTPSIYVGENMKVVKCVFDEDSYTPIISSVTYDKSTGLVSGQTLENKPFILLAVPLRKQVRTNMVVR
jgi:hypothetical protein